MCNRALGLVSAMLLSSLASAAQASSMTEGIPQPNIIYSLHIDGDQVVAASVQELPPSAFSNGSWEPAPPLEPLPLPEEKIHPELTTLIASLAPEEEVEVLVRFQDDYVMLRFPELLDDQPLESPANVFALQQADELISRIRAERDSRYEEYIAALGPKVIILERFWITSSLLVRVPLGEVSRLAQITSVLSLEPDSLSSSPPSCCEVDDGRAYIGMVGGGYDFYGTGAVALLDTGVLETHTQLLGKIGLMRDCVVATGPVCTGGLQYPRDTCNHGTSSAAILAANSNQGAQYRGVTVGTVDSFKVYGKDDCFLKVSAVQRAFQAALANLNKIIVAEMQGDGETGLVSAAGDSAFDAGAVVIAANGNQGQVVGVGAPANAHKVIGVGARSIFTDTTVDQVSGPTSDGRIKPDIQAPTDTETARAPFETPGIGTFSGTSGSTPYAAGAALIQRNKIKSKFNATSVEPGLVYAALIRAGRRTVINQVEGAGALNFAGAGWQFFGSVVLTSGQQVDVPIFVCGTNLWVLNGAIWWPEAAFAAHRRFELSLVDPGGVVRSTGSHPTSVFQKVGLTSGLVHGNWKLRIRAVAVPGGVQQTVYWSANFEGQYTCGFP